jgi:hypothetical protein
MRTTTFKLVLFSVTILLFTSSLIQAQLSDTLLKEKFQFDKFNAVKSFKSAEDTLLNGFTIKKGMSLKQVQMINTLTSIPQTGLLLGGYKAIYRKGDITVPILLFSERDSINEFTGSFNPALGFGFSFAWELIKKKEGDWEATKILAFQPIILLTRRSDDKIALATGFSLGILNNHFQIGYAYSFTNVEGLTGRNMLLLGTSINLDKLIPTSGPTGE